MRAVVRTILSNDFDERMWKPEVADSFSFWITVLVGPAESEGEESIQVQVCTPRWLLENHKAEDVLIGWRRIVVFEYDWQRLSETVREWVASWHAEDWHTLVLHLARLGAWEFDDYGEGHVSRPG
jgi:hypothetical protein